MVNNRVMVRGAHPTWLRYSLADTTGGDIHHVAGGSLSRNGKTLNIPETGKWSVEEADLWLTNAGKQIKDFVDPNASLWEQAYVSMELSRAFVTASRNAILTPQAATQLNFKAPPLTFEQVRNLYSKDFSGSALYRKIIAYAEEQTRKLGCFVAGTLVHPREGLKRIEQIRVGDWVLSKPESGEGEIGYKRVVKTYEYDDREVYFVMYSTLNAENEREYGHVVVTGAHPFWVKKLVKKGEVKDFSAWVCASKLDILNDETLLSPMFELQDGRLARYELSGPVLRTANPNIGLIFYDPLGNFLTFPEGGGVDFSQGYPKVQTDEFGLIKKVDLGVDRDYLSRDQNSESIYCVTGGCNPLLTKVYNLEVEEFHTYFVDTLGVWVHNTSGEDLLNGPRVPGAL